MLNFIVKAQPHETSYIGTKRSSFYALTLRAFFKDSSNLRDDPICEI